MWGIEMFTVPAGFAERFADEDGGPEWLAALPGLVSAYLDRWDLTVDGPTMTGFVSVVLPVRRADGTEAVLKVGWPHPEAEHEALALALWDGDGAVRLLEHSPDDWALLLERLDPAGNLLDPPIEEALAVVSSLIRRLDRPAPPQVRHLRDVAATLAEDLPVDNADEGHPVPADLIEQAVAYCRELGPRAASRLLNEDLHYENVLRGTREPWLVIDPKPLAGDPEFGVIPLLWNRVPDNDLHDRLSTLVDATGFDPARTRKWTFVRAVENWIWADQDSDDPSDRHSAVIAQALA